MLGSAVKNWFPFDAPFLFLFFMSCQIKKIFHVKEWLKDSMSFVFFLNVYKVVQRSFGYNFLSFSIKSREPEMQMSHLDRNIQRLLIFCQNSQQLLETAKIFKGPSCSKTLPRKKKKEINWERRSHS